MHITFKSLTNFNEFVKPGELILVDFEILSILVPPVKKIVGIALGLGLV
jgi:hypothetical protein